MQIVHTIAHLSRKTGGTARCVPPLCDHLCDAGLGVDLVTQAQPGAVPVFPQRSAVGLRLVWAESRRRRLDNFHLALEQLAGRPNGVSIVHDHGVWLANNHLSAEFCRQRKIPRVVSVHGMLSSWAMRNNRAKKRVAWLTYQGSDLEHAALLHATAMQEYLDIRAQGLRNPVAVIPNGIEFPPQPLRLSSRDAHVRRVLFLGRIHPVKGLLDLVQAWSLLSPLGWEVCIAGPDEGGHQREVAAEIERLRLSGKIRFLGAVDDAAKWHCFSEADLFVLPSHSENFGLVVAEALAAGVPVIATKGTPWAGLELHGCGWWCEIGIQGLADAMRLALNSSDEERLQMGVRGRAWVEKSFGWEAVAASFSRVYSWLLKGGGKPTEVCID